MLAAVLLTSALLLVPPAAAPAGPAFRLDPPPAVDNLPPFPDSGRGVSEKELPAWLAKEGKAAAKARERERLARYELRLAAAKTEAVDFQAQASHEQWSFLRRPGEPQEARCKFVFARPDDKKLAVAELAKLVEQQKKLAADPPALLPGMSGDSLTPGRCGVLRKVGELGEQDRDRRTVRVLQVLDAGNLLVTLREPVAGGTQTLWLEMPTSGIADGQTIDLANQLFLVVGTRSYTTPLKTSQTVFHLRAYQPPRPSISGR